MSDGLMQLGRRPVARPTGSPLFQSGFRPFFLLAALVAAVSIVAWLLIVRGVLLPQGALLGVDLHVHEMIFGFVAAVIAGFLLTAVKNWTGRAPASPAMLGVLVVAFVLGRIAVLAEAAGAPRGVSALELLFLPLLALAIARPIAQVRDRRNAGVALLVGLLATVDVVMHVAAWNQDATLAASMRAAALLVPCVLLSVIGGRVIPLFTRNVVMEQGVEVRARNVVDGLTVAATAAVALLAAVAPFSSLVRTVEPIVAIAAGLLTLLRMRGWASTRTRGRPILWILHVGHASLGVGLLLRGVALAAPAALPVSVAMHILALGALSTLCLGMMTRVALGHTGRPLDVPRMAVGGYHSLLTALALRVGAAWVPALLDPAVLFFAIAFLLFFASYLKVLLRPRPDGAPG